VFALIAFDELAASQRNTTMLAAIVATAALVSLTQGWGVTAHPRAGDGETTRDGFDPGRSVQRQDMDP
jgi:hypothetical protein